MSVNGFTSASSSFLKVWFNLLWTLSSKTALSSSFVRRFRGLEFYTENINGLRLRLSIDPEFFVVVEWFYRDCFTPNLKLSLIKKTLSSTLPRWISIAIEWFNKFLLGFFLNFLAVKGMSTLSSGWGLTVKVYFWMTY